uniref:Uncharacterized protein n=1 Tax=Anguilla anguilla TaxID=7936 RepID=A0A0E9RM09_ANGAN
MFLYKVFQLDLGDPGGCILGVLSDATHGWELVPKTYCAFLVLICIDNESV